MSGFEMMQTVSWLQHVEHRAQGSAADGRERARGRAQKQAVGAVAAAPVAAPFTVVTPARRQAARRTDGEPRSA